MTGISSLLVVAALAAGVAQDSPAAGRAPNAAKAGAAAEPASLAFNAKDQVFVGAAYGIEAVDFQPRVYGERTTTAFEAGRRTISYACPGAELGIDGARITYDFEPGGRYELVCRTGKEAEIRRVDNC